MLAAPLHGTPAAGISQTAALRRGRKVAITLGIGHILVDNNFTLLLPLRNVHITLVVFTFIFMSYSFVTLFGLSLSSLITFYLVSEYIVTLWN